MSKDTLEVISAQQGDRLDRIKEYHYGCVGAFGQQMGYAFLAGAELNAAKEEIPHGHFMEWRERYLPEVSKSSATRYMAFAEAIAQKTHTVGNLDLRQVKLINGHLPDDTKQEVLKAVHDIADGKTLTQLYRDLGVIRQPTPPGGFRPDAKALQAWLKEHHPDLAGTKYDDLPEPIQKAFRKQYKPKPDPALEAETARDAINHGFEILRREFDDAGFAHFHMDDPEHVALLEDHIAFLSGDLLPALRTQLKGAPKTKRSKAH